MIRETFPVGPLACNCTILGDETSRDAIVVDPGYDIPAILLRLARISSRFAKSSSPTRTSTTSPARSSSSASPAHPSSTTRPTFRSLAIMDEQAAWLDVATPRRPTARPLPRRQRTISIRGLDANVLHTPGHTEGSLCLHLPEHKLLLAGDTLFAGSVGRTDLPGGNRQPLRQHPRTPSSAPG